MQRTLEKQIPRGLSLEILNSGDDQYRLLIGVGEDFPGGQREVLQQVRGKLSELGLPLLVKIESGVVRDE